MRLIALVLLLAVMGCSASTRVQRVEGVNCDSLVVVYETDRSRIDSVPTPINN